MTYLPYRKVLFAAYLVELQNLARHLVIGLETLIMLALQSIGFNQYISTL
jgi:hypothetical protein